MSLTTKIIPKDTKLYIIFEIEDLYIHTNDNPNNKIYICNEKSDSLQDSYVILERDISIYNITTQKKTLSDLAFNPSSIIIEDVEDFRDNLLQSMDIPVDADGIYYKGQIIIFDKSIISKIQTSDFRSPTNRGGFKI